MTHFILGMITAAVLALSTVGLNKLSMFLIVFLRQNLNSNDTETLNKLLRYKVQWLIELAFVLIIFAMGLLCGVIQIGRASCRERV